jgi:hypothetical protein
MQTKCADRLDEHSMRWALVNMGLPSKCRISTSERDGSALPSDSRPTSRFRWTVAAPADGHDDEDGDGHGAATRVDASAT